MSIKSQIESLLFVSAKPITIKQLADVLKSGEKEIEAAGDELAREYNSGEKGTRIIRDGRKLQMVSASENAGTVQAFLKDETTGELSRPSLETLTIIAYRGPIPKFDLDRVRGVNCSLILRNLLLRGLIEAVEDKDKKEIYYSVTLDFIRFLGVGDLRELPDYEKLRTADSPERMLEGAEG
jgi:segregation and condensation protein B